MAVVTCIYIGPEEKTAGILSLQLGPPVSSRSVHGPRLLKQPQQLTEERNILRPGRKDAGKTRSGKETNPPDACSTSRKARARWPFSLEGCERREASANERKKGEAGETTGKRRDGTGPRVERLPEAAQTKTVLHLQNMLFTLAPRVRGALPD